MNHDEKQADVGTQRLARVYATALLDAADKVGQTQEILAEADSFVDDIYHVQPGLEVFFSSPAVGRNARQSALEKAFTGRASDLFLRFLLVLNEHERLGVFRAIRTALHAVDNERRRVIVQVYSAIPLNDEQKSRIAAGVRERFQLEPILETHVEPALLGGLKIRIGDRQFDATVRTRLDDIRTQIFTRSSHEIQSGRDRFSHS